MYEVHDIHSSTDNPLICHASRWLDKHPESPGSSPIECGSRQLAGTAIDMTAVDAATMSHANSFTDNGGCGRSGELDLGRTLRWYPRKPYPARKEKRPKAAKTLLLNSNSRPKE